MYFQSIDTCKYFAERLNNQPSIPNPRAGDGDPKTHNYIAVCEPRRVDPEKTKIYWSDRQNFVSNFGTNYCDRQNFVYVKNKLWNL